VGRLPPPPCRAFDRPPFLVSPIFCPPVSAEETHVPLTEELRSANPPPDGAHFPSLLSSIFPLSHALPSHSFQSDLHHPVFFRCLFHPNHRTKRNPETLVISSLNQLGPLALFTVFSFFSECPPFSVDAFFLPRLFSCLRSSPFFLVPSAIFRD